MVRRARASTGGRRQVDGAHARQRGGTLGSRRLGRTLRFAATAQAGDRASPSAPRQRQSYRAAENCRRRLRPTCCKVSIAGSCLRCRSRSGSPSSARPMCLIAGIPVRLTSTWRRPAICSSLAGRFFKSPLRREDVVWSYSGVRPLYDDQNGDPSAVTPRLPPGSLPLAARAAAAADRRRRQGHHLPASGGRGARASAAVSSRHARAVDGDRAAAGRRHARARLRFVAGRDCSAAFPALRTDFLRRLARRHGTRTLSVIGDARTEADMGRSFGASGLTEREVVYLKFAGVGGNAR